MSRKDSYVDLKGTQHSLAALDREERDLLRRAEERCRQDDWAAFQNFCAQEIGGFYQQRGLSRRKITHTTLWRVAQDMGSRKAVAEGWMRASDYRDELEQLILTRFQTRRAFCEATGLSEDMLSHVLSKRKHLAITTLSEALERVGYALHIVPRQEA